ncbi:hypothetical protein [Methylobacterium sp. J-090]|uniref:hypothetical protein n=1 Tax=Methylobacterium sp. J-090 TaxID=2836666 RepID=UPI001FBA94DB|nr:hypothetical protein [Methylobacterium sp. J-090]MCJ2080357.1 hypothetical protein [Methylobacterium sp. J-090]
MTSRIPLIAALVLAVGSAHPVLAQSPAETGTGGNVTTTTRAPNTTSVGQTKPPGAAAGGEVDQNLDQRTKQQKKDREITKGICTGCN